MKNIYLYSIELALKSDSKITYVDLISKLEGKFPENTYKNEYFKYWFLTNFYIKHCYEWVESGKAVSDSDFENTYKNYEGFLTYKALSYYENNRSNSTNKTIAIVAIIIAILTPILTPIIQSLIAQLVQ